MSPLFPKPLFRRRLRMQRNRGLTPPARQSEESVLGMQLDNIPVGHRMIAPHLQAVRLFLIP